MADQNDEIVVPKNWYKSKTFWFNVAGIVVSVAGEVSGVFPISKHPQFYAGVILVGNLLLRFVTKKPIE